MFYRHVGNSLPGRHLMSYGHAGKGLIRFLFKKNPTWMIFIIIELRRLCRTECTDPPPPPPPPHAPPPPPPSLYERSIFSQTSAPCSKNLTTFAATLQLSAASTLHAVALKDAAFVFYLQPSCQSALMSAILYIIYIYIYTPPS